MTTLVHPLVLVNVCDHLERARQERALLREGRSMPTSGDEDEKVVAALGAPLCGALFGLQSGTKVEIFTSIEAKVSKRPMAGEPSMPDAEGGSEWQIDEGLLKKWVVMVSEVYAGYELLGWYSLCDSLGAEEEGIHRQFTAFNESPVLLQIRPTGVAPGITEVPMSVFLGQEKGQGGLTFLPQPFTVDASDTERTVVEHIFSALAVKGGGGGGGGGGALKSASSSSSSSSPVSTSPVSTSPAVASATSKLAALKVLSERVALIKAYVDNLAASTTTGSGSGSGSGSAPISAAAVGGGAAGRSALRSIRALLSRMPVGGGNKVEGELHREAVDALLVATSAGVICGGAGLSSLLEKLGVLGGSLAEGGGGGMGGMGMGMGMGMDSMDGMMMGGGGGRSSKGMGSKGHHHHHRSHNQGGGDKGAHKSDSNKHTISMA